MKMLVIQIFSEYKFWESEVFKRKFRILPENEIRLKAKFIAEEHYGIGHTIYINSCLN